MKLTGKAGKDFLNWFLSKNYDHKKNALKVGLGQSIMEAFYNLQENMQWGVYVDFFDSVGIHIDAMAVGEDPFKEDTDWAYYAYAEHESTEDLESRAKAREVAIKMANELYNKLNG